MVDRDIDRVRFKIEVILLKKSSALKESGLSCYLRESLNASAEKLGKGLHLGWDIPLN